MFNNNSQRPARLVEILTKSLQIYRSKFLTIAIITLIINVPINLAITIMPSYPFEAILAQKYDLADLKYIFIILIITLFFAPISTMAVAYLTREAVENKDIDVISGLNAAFFKWVGMVTASVIFLSIIALSSLAIVLPIYFLNVYSFYLFAIILSGKSGYQALKYSKDIVKGRWLKVLLYWILLFMINQCVLFVVSTVFVGFANNIIISMICDSILTVIGSYFVCAQTIWFLDLEATKKVEDRLS